MSVQYTRQRWLLPAAWMALLLFWAPVPAAFAHAALLSAEPADGAALDGMPAQAVLHFNEPVSPLRLQLALPDGRLEPLAQAAAEGSSLQVPLPPRQAPGSYGLSWRVVSLDGHPVGGTLTFTLGAVPPARDGSAAPGPADAGSRPALDAITLLGRWALYAALLFGAAAAAFPYWTGARRDCVPPPWTTRLIALGLPAIVLSLAAQGLDALAAGPSALLGTTPWRAALSTRYAATLCLALLALASARMAWRMRGAGARAAFALAAPLLTALAFAASGHASTAPPAWLARPLVMLHVLAAALWLGALIPLHRAARAGATVALSDALTAFSHRIRGVVLTLLASGALLAWTQLGGLEGLAAPWRSDYGRVLLAKLAGVAVLLTLAGWNRWRLSGPAQRGEANAAGALRRVVAAEIAVALAVLALVSLWRLTPPPRAALQQTIQEAENEVWLHGDGLMARLRCAPRGASSQAELRIALSDHAGRAISPLGLRITLSRPEQGIEPIRLDARPDGPEGWLAAPLRLPALPSWHLRIDALIDDFDARSLEGEFALPPAHH